ncbi:protein pns1 [Anaeramoeba ignava]|uniref:Choline transporter-like protein n=1 Tax=Anaeramoeba ignava TaxID=1746090 RepID=A0A9Q0R4V9_ANAIG|nr:protein pns1 [Anaeramoeba ignava]
MSHQKFSSEDEFQPVDYNPQQPFYQQPQMNPQQPFYQQPQMNQMNQQYYQQQPMNQMNQPHYQQPMNQPFYEQENQMNEQMIQDIEKPHKQTSDSNVDENDLGDKFKKPKFNDVWAFFLFIAHLVVLFVVTTRFKSNSTDYNNDSDRSYSGKYVLTVLILSMVCGVIGAFVWIQLMKKYAKGLIKFTFIAGIVFTGLLAIAMFVLGSVVGGIIFLFCFIISIILYRVWAKRIPFSAVLLVYVTKTLQKYPAMITIAFLFGVVLQIAWTFAWIYVAIVTYNISSKYWAIYIVFSYFWTSGVITNLIHTTSSGTYASYYFLKGNMPKDPTFQSFKRAITYSFGSICVGSLIVAIIKTLRWIARVSESNDNGFLKCMCLCFLNCLDWLAEFFNQFAYAYISIYGINFLQASKKTFNLFKERGLNALINDDLINGVVNMAAISTGIFAGIISGIITYFAFNHDKIWIAFSLISLLIALFISLVVLETVTSGVTTFFVCFAEAPEVIQQLDPNLSQKLRSTYNFRF